MEGQGSEKRRICEMKGFDKWFGGSGMRGLERIERDLRGCERGQKGLKGIRRVDRS